MHIKFECLPRSTFTILFFWKHFLLFFSGAQVVMPSLLYAPPMAHLQLQLKVLRGPRRPLEASQWTTFWSGDDGLYSYLFVIILIDAAKKLHTFVLHDSVNQLDWYQNRIVSSKTTQPRKDADICAMGRVVHWTEISPVNTSVLKGVSTTSASSSTFSLACTGYWRLCQIEWGDYFFSNLKHIYIYIRI